MIEDKKIQSYLREVIANMPMDWLNLTTHRLDIYDEELAKTQFLKQFDDLYKSNNSEASALQTLPTAYDYIRLGHPLSCVLEWGIARSHHLNPNHVISFSSKTIPVLAILRKNLLENKSTQIFYTDELPEFFDAEVLKSVYKYQFELKKVESAESIPAFDGSTIFISPEDELFKINLNPAIDFFISIHALFGSVIVVNEKSFSPSSKKNESYISEIQHVRRRETVAMTPHNCLAALNLLIGDSSFKPQIDKVGDNQAIVLDSIAAITGTDTKALLASSGLSIQYAIMMGLIHDALETHQGKDIKFIVPPNCYGGTNDQARRVAACINNVEVVDLPVDGGRDMVQSIDLVLDKIANDDAVPYIIAEIPTNPRVEVPDLIKLKAVLSKERKTPQGKIAIEPVFILDQTFCPNVRFLGEGDILSTVRCISYVSGSKFPSGGLCTAGYCVGNKKTAPLMEKIEKHLRICDNEATDHQIEVLAKQMPSMNQRIEDAYQNTRAFVDFISETLPDAKINFVSKELAGKGFTPSVFSLDLPTRGDTDEQKEVFKRELNHQLIDLMIKEIPDESKFCVSYGQLNGCYWTIPATSTQGTTKEGDKDYIVRVALSPHINLELHKKVFSEFATQIRSADY